MCPLWGWGCYISGTGIAWVVRLNVKRFYESTWVWKHVCTDNIAVQQWPKKDGFSFEETAAHILLILISKPLLGNMSASGLSTIGLGPTLDRVAESVLFEL